MSRFIFIFEPLTVGNPHGVILRHSVPLPLCGLNEPLASSEGLNTRGVLTAKAD